MTDDHAHSHTEHSGYGCGSKAAVKVETATCCGGHGDHAGHAHHHHDGAVQTVLDPVCGMTVNPATSKHRCEHNGETFHFCSAGCRTKFSVDPAKYLNKSEAKPEPA